MNHLYGWHIDVFTAFARGRLSDAGGLTFVTGSFGAKVMNRRKPSRTGQAGDGARVRRRASCQQVLRYWTRHQRQDEFARTTHRPQHVKSVWSSCRPMQQVGPDSRLKPRRSRTPFDRLVAKRDAPSKARGPPGRLALIAPGRRARRTAAWVTDFTMETPV